MTNLAMRQRNRLQPNAWDPFAVARAMLQWDPFAAGTEMVAAKQSHIFTPAFDIVEEDEAYVMTADVPGIAEDDLDVTVTGNRLTVSGTKADARERDSGAYHVYERSYGSFSRSFTLPSEADVSDVSADLDGGVLTLRIPKRTEAKSRKIPLRERIANKLRS